MSTAWSNHDPDGTAESYQSIPGHENGVDIEGESQDERKDDEATVTSYRTQIGIDSMPPSSVSSGNSNSSSSGPRIFFYMTLLVALSAIAAGFYHMFVQQRLMMQNIQNLSSRLDFYQHNTQDKVHSLHESMKSLNNKTDSREHKIDSALDSLSIKFSDMDTVINRLNNRTTNADVLDKLEKTHNKLESEMKDTTEEVESRLHDATKGIRSQLEANLKQINNTRLFMERQLQQTVLVVDDIVDTATDNIHGIEKNVTRQLHYMEDSLDKTVQKLNTDIKVAEDKIHSDVNILQQNVDQYVEVTNKQFAQADDFLKYQLAGTFTLLGCLISMWHLTGHLRHYAKPQVQKRIMAVLWMVPIYGITSWLSLVLPGYEHIFGALRDCYEAYAIYTFIALLIAILEDGAGLPMLLQKLTQQVVEEKAAAQEAIDQGESPPKLHLKPPFPCCFDYHRPSSIAKAWLFQCQLMAMQFVLTKPFLSIVPLIFWCLGKDYDSHPPLTDGHHIDWTSPKLYVLVVSNTSVAVAFWGLLNFYHGTEKELTWCNPWPKFLCIKGVVFMTFWQGLAIQAMSSVGFVGVKQASQIQNLLTCIEMLLASLAHFYIFPHYEWQDGYKREQEKNVLIRDTLALRDFVTDMRLMTSKWEGGEDEDPDETMHSESSGEELMFKNVGSTSGSAVGSPENVFGTSPGSAPGSGPSHASSLKSVSGCPPRHGKSRDSSGGSMDGFNYGSMMQAGIWRESLGSLTGFQEERPHVGQHLDIRSEKSERNIEKALSALEQNYAKLEELEMAAWSEGGGTDSGKKSRHSSRGHRSYDSRDSNESPFVASRMKTPPKDQGHNDKEGSPDSLEGQGLWEERLSHNA